MTRPITLPILLYAAAACGQVHEMDIILSVSLRNYCRVMEIIHLLDLV